MLHISHTQLFPLVFPEYIFFIASVLNHFAFYQNNTLAHNNNHNRYICSIKTEIYLSGRLPYKLLLPSLWDSQKWPPATDN